MRYTQNLKAEHVMCNRSTVQIDPNQGFAFSTDTCPHHQEENKPVIGMQVIIFIATEIALQVIALNV